MGWDLAVFAINKNYENKIEELSKALFKSERHHLVEGKNKYHFEQSATFGSTKGRMDFMFTEKGSLAFCNVMEVPYILGSRNSELLKGTEMVLFAMSETSMVFVMKYYIDGIKTREIQIIEGRTECSFGDPIEQEIGNNNMEELLFELAGELIGIGIPINSIDLDTQFRRFTKKKKIKNK